MKNLIPAILAAVTVTTTFLTASAQDAENPIAISGKKANPIQSDTTERTANDTDTHYKSGITLSRVSDRVLKKFAKSFRSAANADWYDDGEGGLIAYFNDSATYTKVDYDKKGNWVYSMSRYGEKELPVYITYSVKASYPMNTVVSATEIHYLNQISYFISLENKDGYKIIRYTDEGGVEEMEDLPRYSAGRNIKNNFRGRP